MFGRKNWAMLWCVMLCRKKVHLTFIDRKLLIVREALDFFLLLFNHLSCGVSPLLLFRLDSIAFSLFVCSYLSVATGKCEVEEGEGKREIKWKTGNEREDKDMKS